MCRGSFDEQNLESSESWLERYYSSALSSRVLGKKMWKKGRGTTERFLGNSRAYIKWIILLIEREGLYRAGGSMRAAIYVRVSFDDGRQTVENQEQQLVE